MFSNDRTKIYKYSKHSSNRYKMPKKTPYEQIGEDQFVYRTKIQSRSYNNDMTVPADIAKLAKGKEVEVIIKILE